MIPFVASKIAFCHLPQRTKKKKKKTQETDFTAPNHFMWKVNVAAVLHFITYVTHNGSVYIVKYINVRECIRVSVSETRNTLLMFLFFLS